MSRRTEMLLKNMEFVGYNDLNKKPIPDGNASHGRWKIFYLFGVLPDNGLMIEVMIRRIRCPSGSRAIGPREWGRSGPWRRFRWPAES